MHDKKYIRRVRKNKFTIIFREYNIILSKRSLIVLKSLLACNILLRKHAIYSWYSALKYISCIRLTLCFARDACLNAQISRATLQCRPSRFSWPNFHYRIVNTTYFQLQILRWMMLQKCKHSKWKSYPGMKYYAICTWHTTGWNFNNSFTKMEYE